MGDRRVRYSPPPTVAEPLYPERRGAEVRIVGYSRDTMKDDNGRRVHVPAPVLVEFSADSFRGIAEEEELR